MSLTTLANDDVDTTFVADGTGGALIGYVSGEDSSNSANWVFKVTLDNVTATGADYNTVLYKPVDHPVTDDPGTDPTPVEIGFEDNLGVSRGSCCPRRRRRDLLAAAWRHT